MLVVRRTNLVVPTLLAIKRAKAQGFLIQDDVERFSDEVERMGQWPKQ